MHDNSYSEKCSFLSLSPSVEQFAYTNGEKEYYMDELRADLQKVGLNDFDGTSFRSVGSTSLCIQQNT